MGGDEKVKTPSDKNPPPFPSVPKAVMAQIGFVKPFEPEVDSFRDWLGALRSFMLANGLDYKKDDEMRCRHIFLSLIGLKTFALLKSLVAPAKVESVPLLEAVNKLKAHYHPNTNAIAERFRFMSRKQGRHETASQFVAELRSLASNCNFSDTELDTRLRDQFIFGLNSKSAQRTLFTQKDSVDLAECLKLVLASELAEQSTAIVRG